MELTFQDTHAPRYSAHAGMVSALPRGVSTLKGSQSLNVHFDHISAQLFAWGSFISTPNLKHCLGIPVPLPLPHFFFQNWTQGSKYTEISSLKYEKTYLFCFKSLVICCVTDFSCGDETRTLLTSDREPTADYSTDASKVQLGEPENFIVVP